jgi:hypothetical protein
VKRARRGNRTGQPKTVVVVAVVGVVVVAIGGAAVARVVVPGTAAQQPVLPYPFSSPW